MADDELNVVLPTPDALPALLLKLAVPHEDIDPLVAHLPDRDSPSWRELERCTRLLVRDLGRIGGPPVTPEPPDGSDIPLAYFPLYVFLAAYPHITAFHRDRGISDEISWHTLTDLGRVLADHRYWHGEGGLDAELTGWLTLHFSGQIYQLGRLQFQRARLGNRTGRAVAAAGHPFGPGDPALSVHVPGYYGPLRPEACSRSFAAARDFFARHFPEETYRIAVCNSWLLDEQLGDYLPAEANILQFQRRFQPAYQPAQDDETMRRFVFGVRRSDRGELPRRTALERAIVDHLEAGHHWHGGAGWALL
ncbi:acyltransferase domain-containing protein [Kribbella sp. DT2]|uniref:acyltransferase domain-containing protein n=1 Tax=Kribbella sp. DT2 TaxID=3393427 RepID=UPI003CF381DA